MAFLGRWKIGPKEHARHHSRNVGNFGSMFGFWDWVMGTSDAGGDGDGREANLRSKDERERKIIDFYLVFRNYRKILIIIVFLIYLLELTTTFIGKIEEESILLFF